MKDEGKRRDYAAFWSALGNRALNEEATSVGEAVVLAMADHYGVSAASPRWQSTTHEFHQWLVGVVQHLQITAPDWLVQHSPAVLIHECVPAGLNDRISFGRYLESSTQLRALLPEKSGATTEVEELRRAAHFRYRDVVCEVLRADAHRLSTVHNDRQAAVVALSAYLESARAELYATVLQHTSSSDDGDPPRVDPPTVKRLTVALDDYHRAVSSIVYPHKSDPYVIRVPVDQDIGRAAELPDNQFADPVERLRSAIGRAVLDDHAAMASWPHVRHRTSTRSPTARLERGLAAALTGPRLQEVLAPVPGESSIEKICHLVPHGRLPAVLDEMTSSELDLLLSSISEVNTPPRPPLTAKDAVLINLGVTTQSTSEPRGDAAEALRQKGVALLE
ncbi:MAG TPA: hypothetical protein VNP92_07125 [Actinophytocola sp.]|nr:hypothetical protein [Actinophytocola sp.]